MLIDRDRHPATAPTSAAGGGVAGWLGRRLSAYLTRPSRPCSAPLAVTPARKLMACLRPGDVLLVEGKTRFSTVIKYLTQSTWSHAAIYVGPLPGARDADGAPRCFVEADIKDGVRAVGVAEFDGLHCRVCRPVGLAADDVARVVRFVVDRIGYQYDLRNVLDLARYLLPTLPLPKRWRRHLLTLGSGDPTRAICSTLIAQAFQSVRYPILPTVRAVPANDPGCPGCTKEVMQARHYSLFVPRDFDVSPYFDVVKPEIAHGFDHRAIEWADRLDPLPMLPETRFAA